MLHKVTTWLSSLRARVAGPLDFERDVMVSVSDTGVTAEYPTGAVLTIKWSSIERIIVETNDSGPWGVDLWWIVEGPTETCSFPLGATGEEAAIFELKRRFEGFEVRGMNSTSNARFVRWEKLHAL